MKELLGMLLALSVGGSVLAAVLMLLQRLMKMRLPAAFAYYAWLLVLLRFVLPLPGLLPAAEVRARPQAAPTAAVAVAEAHPSVQIGTPGTPRPYLEGGQAVGPVFPAEEPAPPEQAAKPAPSFDPARLWRAAKALVGSWGFWGAVYLAGLGISLLRYGVGYVRFRRALGRTIRPARESDRLVLEALNPSPWPTLCRSSAVHTPMLLGLLRPVIVLPEREYDGQMLRGILRHELTHYRRGDLVYKWFAVLVSCLHWFNPFLALFRREIDRACELSCDERLLRHMGREEKQQYGELLLTLAADRPLPRSVVAMSFATEKKNLKERLVQIMKYKSRGRAGLALALTVLLLLSGCGMALGPNSGAAALTANGAPEVVVTPFLIDPGADTSLVPMAAAVSEVPPTPMPAEDGGEVAALQGENLPGEQITVRNVDELLAAIGSDRVILMTDGEYDLTKAAGYGSRYSTEHLVWYDCGDGYELQITGVQNLRIVGHGRENTSIVTTPRYANVLRFDSCSGVTLASLTAGHTVEPGFCSGGVLSFDGCENMMVAGCDLYGCGTLGISAVNCRGVSATGTVIHDCSYGAVEAIGCYDVRFVGGKVENCGIKGDFTAFDLFLARTTTGFAVFNTEICGNKAQTLLHSAGSLEVQMRGCDIHDISISRESETIVYADGSSVVSANGGLFHITGESPVIADCAFSEIIVQGKGMYFNYDGEKAGTVADDNGRELTLYDLADMERKEYLETYYGPHQKESSRPEGEENGQGEMVYHVDNADDFLAAIGSNTTIYVDAELIDFSEASAYGGYGSPSYYWLDSYDGPNLVISGVENLHIIGQGKGKTTLQAVPRYAEVLNFENCSNISVEDLTAGHRKEAPGSCAGDVLEFTNCGEILVRNCGLFGCGVNAITASSCQGLTVEDTEMYECSNLGAQLFQSSGVSFKGCEIHDCHYDSIYLSGCVNVLWEGVALHEGNNNVG